MPKIHTRIKRKYGLSRRLNPYCYFHPTKKIRRAKTFKTEKDANAWAVSKGLGQGQYYLKSVKKGKKLQVMTILNESH